MLLFPIRSLAVPMLFPWAHIITNIDEPTTSSGHGGCTNFTVGPFILSLFYSASSRTFWVRIQCSRTELRGIQGFKQADRSWPSIASYRRPRSMPRGSSAMAEERIQMVACSKTSMVSFDPYSVGIFVRVSIQIRKSEAVSMYHLHYKVGGS